MTSKTSKLRAVFLTALMIGSVFGAGIAFTGGAAAASPNTVSITPNSVSDGSTNTHSITLEAGSVNTNDSTSQVFAVDLNDTLDLSSAGVTNFVVNAGNVSWGGTYNVNSTTNVVTVTTSDDGSGINTDTVNVTFDLTNVAAPTVNSDQTTTVYFGVDANADGDYTDSGDVAPSSGATTSLTVTNMVSAPDADKKFSSASGLNGSLIYQGQTFALNVSGQIADGKEVQLRRVTDTGSTPVSTKTVENGWVKFSSEGRQTANYFLRGGSGALTKSNSQFEIVKQDLSATFVNANGDAVSSVGNAGTTTKVTLDVTSDIRNGYNVYVTVSGFDRADYVDVFPTITAESQVLESDSGTLFIAVSNVESNAPVLNFSGFSAGNHTATAIVTDASASASDKITVEDVGAGQATFPSEGFSEERGDWAAITVDLANTNKATVNVGSYGVNYLAQMNVEDGNNDGKVTILMNTYYAGQSGTAADAVYMAANDEDRVYSETRKTNNLTDPLATGDYTVNATIGGEETGVTTLFLDERATTGASTHIAPSDAKTKKASQIRDATTKRQNVAKGDKTVLKFEASGLYGYVDSNYNFTYGSSDADSHGVYLSIKQTAASTAPNAPRNTIKPTNVKYVFDSANNTFYAIIDTGNLKAKQVYDATLVVNASSPYIPDSDATQTVTTSFSVEERKASFDSVSQQGVLAVPPQKGVKVSGHTNLAPGTQLNVRARSTVQGNSFIMNPSATVQQDGTFSATFDFSSYANGTQFSWSLRKGSTVLTSPDGLVTKAAGTTTTKTTTETTTKTTTQTTTQTTTETTTKTTTKTTTTTSTPTSTTTTEGGGGGGIPGFGMGIALVAVLGAALLALRE